MSIFRRSRSLIGGFAPHREKAPCPSLFFPFEQISWHHDFIGRRIFFFFFSFPFYRDRPHQDSTFFYFYFFFDEVRIPSPYRSKLVDPCARLYVCVCVCVCECESIFYVMFVMISVLRTTITFIFITR